MAEPRRGGFALTVLVGLAAGVGAAVGGNQVWVVADLTRTEESASLVTSFVLRSEGASVPLATALGLVVLACWGVVLVSRGRARRVVAGLGALAALATLVTYVVGAVTTMRDLADDFDAAGLPGVDLDLTRWFFFGLACAVVSAAAAVLAVRSVRGWPEMGSRYDAPGEQGTAKPAEDPSNLDLWKALDQGDDPTR
ncbi:Trp biosynthesis-associated membrane protein [Nocardioides sp. 503]|uniref:Trp biosynthesis-associated membrane protein n=1 Tax=Nocardioides sp. 503 TaxID=2508326 RepID=UPI0014304059|nr:Trp biosynthesis-associated membrane protein [Nocardioides sp. 503]